MSAALVLALLLGARAEVTFLQLEENQTLELSCSPRPDGGGGGPVSLHLFRRRARAQTTLLSLAGGRLRVDPGVGRRLRLSGGLSAAHVNVSIGGLRPGDTGLYTWELGYGEDGARRSCLGSQRVLLLVHGEGKPCRCSSSYKLLVFTTLTSAGLLLLGLTWLGVEKCVTVKARRRRARPSASIYQEMRCGNGRRSAADAPHPRREPSHLEEAGVPVYADPDVRQSQDNYYARPRAPAAGSPPGPGSAPPRPEDRGHGFNSQEKSYFIHI